MTTGSSYERVYTIVKRIPRGRVATYGQIAALIGLPRGARQVGYALAALPAGSKVPWHRVVNAKGAVSLPGHTGVTQRLRLVREGAMPARGRVVDLQKRRWSDSKRGTTKKGGNDPSFESFPPF